MATTAEAAVCNIALARCGITQFITDLNPVNDASQPAAVCAVLYPSVRDKLLSRFRWGWATRVAVLALDTTLTPSAPGNLPGWDHAYSDPTDLLEPQYIFDGLRPGATMAPVLLGNLLGLFGVTQISLLPAINGQVPLPSFEHVDGHIFTDWADDPAAWDSTVTYAKNAITTDATGALYYRSLQAANLNHLQSDGAWWVSVTDPSSAILVYTAQITDATTFPALFTDALQWRLAAELALSLAGRPELADAFDKKAQAVLRTAMAAEGNMRQPDPRPDSSFIAARG
ncbi:MAG: hypothetical protein JST54_12530 [Deltaproteobacteria bacterium]|nr:hypothetical protein [Deltaproteobacteria bacterium]